MLEFGQALLERPPLEDALARALQALPADVPLAVRSSARGEDGRARSFAGLHETVLDVYGLEQLKDAIRVVENGRVRIVRDDWTGKPERVNTALLETLLDAGHVPVVAPVAISDSSTFGCASSSRKGQYKWP